jgi:hypothetical protein
MKATKSGEKSGLGAMVPQLQSASWSKQSFVFTDEYDSGNAIVLGKTLLLQWRSRTVATADGFHAPSLTHHIFAAETQALAFGPACSIQYPLSA